MLTVCCVATFAALAVPGIAETARPHVAPPVPPDGDDAAMVVALYDWFGLIGATDRDGYVALFDDDGGAAVEACMADAGFQFEVPAAGAELRFELPEMTMDANEYAATYGLGIAAGPLGLFGHLEGPPDEERPLDEYVDSLSAGQRDAFFEHLQECYRRESGDDQQRQMAMTVAAPEYRELVLTDGRVVAALETWQGCLAGAGFEFTDPEQMRTSFFEQVEPFYQSAPIEEGSANHAGLERVFAAEREVAMVNAGCEPQYKEVVRDVIADRMDEFWALFDSASADLPSAPPDTGGAG